MRYFFLFEILGITISLAASYLGGLFAREAMENGYYHGLIKSPFTPPDIAFPIIWTIIYILMGVAIGRIWRQKESLLYSFHENMLFFVQLALNIFWTYLFFKAEQPILSFFEIIPFWLLLVYCCICFFKQDFWSGLCFIPYIIWVFLAVYLNLLIVLRN